MKISNPECLKCHNVLAPIEYRDLMGVKGKVSEPPLSQVVEALLTHFELYVCSECGLTELYAPPQVTNLAKEIIEERGGHG
jgi:predicted nucleic-acid-binding Zn-ribbon protein